MIYFLQCQSTLFIKIGFTDGEPGERLRDLQTGSAAGLVLLATCDGDRTVERQLHQKFAHAREHREWFRPTSDVLMVIIRLGQGEAWHQGRKSAFTEMEAADSGQLVPQVKTKWIGKGQCGGDLSAFLETPTQVICPVCGFNYPHLIDPVPHPNIHGNSGVHTLSFAGECGHCWSVCFSSHKGNVDVYVIHDFANDDVPPNIQ